MFRDVIFIAYILLCSMFLFSCGVEEKTQECEQFFESNLKIENDTNIYWVVDSVRSRIPDDYLYDTVWYS
jgi:hypothetical protein